MSESRNVVRLEPWTGPWPDDDPDANFKAEVALYSLVDPLTTIEGLSGSVYGDTLTGHPLSGSKLNGGPGGDDTLTGGRLKRVEAHVRRIDPEPWRWTGRAALGPQRTPTSQV